MLAVTATVTVLAAPAVDAGDPTITTPAVATAVAVRIPALTVVTGDDSTVVNVDQMITAPGVCALRTAADGNSLPDPRCTPGVISDRVTQANITITICASGYTTSVRPSSSVTNKIKAANYVAYAQTPDPRDENDHLVPLELGGANDPRNLWNEPPVPGQVSTTNPKDTVENKLHTLVCAGTLSLADAQHRIATDWTTALADLTN